MKRQPSPRQPVGAKRPRRLDFGEDGTPLPEGACSLSAAMEVAARDYADVPEDLRRRSLAGKLPVSLKALQVSPTRIDCPLVVCLFASLLTTISLPDI